MNDRSEKTNFERKKKLVCTYLNFQEPMSEQSKKIIGKKYWPLKIFEQLRGCGNLLNYSRAPCSCEHVSFCGELIEEQKDVCKSNKYLKRTKPNSLNKRRAFLVFGFLESNVHTK